MVHAHQDAIHLTLPDISVTLILMYKSAIYTSVVNSRKYIFKVYMYYILYLIHIKSLFFYKYKLLCTLYVSDPINLTFKREAGFSPPQ